MHPIKIGRIECIDDLAWCYLVHGVGYPVWPWSVVFGLLDEFSELVFGQDIVRNGRTEAWVGMLKNLIHGSFVYSLGTEDFSPVVTVVRDSLFWTRDDPVRASRCACDAFLASPQAVFLN